MGKNPLREIALECERIALEDEYFVKRKLYPNVDFYTGLIYQSMGFPTTMFPVLFAIPRTAGWIAQWKNCCSTPNKRLRGPARFTSATTPVRTCPSNSVSAVQNELSDDECNDGTVRRRARRSRYGHVVTSGQCSAGRKAAAAEK